MAIAQVQVDPGWGAYKPTSGVSGNVSSRLGHAQQPDDLLGRGLPEAVPERAIQIEGKGSSTAPPALIAGTAQLGPMSRDDEGREIDEFEKKYGYKPTAIKVAVDALAVYVNKDNPVKRLTVQQVDAIFSKTRARCGQDVTTWGQLGLDRRLGAKPISLYGRNSASGTYGFFKEHALCKGDYKDTVKEQPGSASVVQGVTEDQYGIGYSGIGYSTSGVTPCRSPAKNGGTVLDATADNVTPATTRWRASSTSTSTRRPTSRSIRWCASS